MPRAEFPLPPPAPSASPQPGPATDWRSHLTGRPLAWVLLAFSAWPLLCLAAGCSSVPTATCSPDGLVFSERINEGLTVVLPGVLGSEPLEHGITQGLIEADVPSAIYLYDWTEGPSRFYTNLRGEQRNRQEAARVAAKIVDYQTRFPGRPVNLIGYSGGAGLAVMVLESLPVNHKVTTAILLGATLSPSYDLQAAINHSETGIRSYYSPLDTTILVGVVSALGTTDGHHVPAAGAMGFAPPPSMPLEQQACYVNGVEQRPYQPQMLLDGHIGGHFGWIRPDFVRDWIAPQVAESASEVVQMVRVERLPPVAPTDRQVLALRAQDAGASSATFGAVPQQLTALPGESSFGSSAASTATRQAGWSTVATSSPASSSAVLPGALGAEQPTTLPVQLPAQQPIARTAWYTDLLPESDPVSR